MVDISNDKVDIEISDSGNIIFKPRLRNDKIKHRPHILIYAEYASSIGMSIIIPIVLATILGKYIDSRFNSHPKVVLLSIGIGFIISIVSLFYTVKSFLRYTKE